MKDPLKPYKRDDSPSPVTYKEVDTKWRNMSQFAENKNEFSISKCPKSTFTEQVIKDKKKVPAVGSYNTHNMDCLLYTSPSPRDRG